MTYKRRQTASGFLHVTGSDRGDIHVKKKGHRDPEFKSKGTHSQKLSKKAGGKRTIPESIRREYRKGNPSAETAGKKKNEKDGKN